MNKPNLTALLSSSETRSLAASQNVNLKMDIAVAAMSKTLKNDYFDICTVRDVCDVIGARASGPAYDMLKALHCMKYAQMPASVRDEIPSLLNEVFKQAADVNMAMAVAFKGVRA